MLKRILLLILLVSFGLIVAADGIIENSDFSKGFSGWFVTNNNAFSVKDIDGNKCLEVSGVKDQKKNAYIKCSQNLKLSQEQIQGKKFIFSVDVKAVKISGRLDVSIREIDAKGRSVTYRTIKLTKWDDGDWKKFKRSFVPAKKTARLAVYIVGYYLAPDDKIYIKNISIKEVK
jgi:hypothetical protein